MMKQVLIVDDSTFSRSLIKRFLQNESPPLITEASNGEVGLQKFQQQDFDVVFLDLTMPVMDGFSFLRAIQGLEHNSKIFIISADVQPEARKLCMQLGATGFMPKPLEEHTFKDMLLGCGLLQ